MSRSRCLLASAVVAMILVNEAPTRAVEYAWQGGDGGSWAVDANWSSAGFPDDIGDTATVNNGDVAHAITLAADTTVGRFSVGYVTDAADKTGNVVLAGPHALTIGQSGTAGLLHVGSSLNDGSVGKATGSLHLANGTTLSLVGGTFYLGSRAVTTSGVTGGHTTGMFTMTEGAALNVGTAGARSAGWEIGLQKVAASAMVSKGTFEATGGTLTAYLNTVTVGDNVRGGAHASGNRGEGILDLTGLQIATIDTRRLLIGYSSIGNAKGVVKLGSGSHVSVGTNSLAGELSIGAPVSVHAHSDTGTNTVTGRLELGPGASLTVGTPQLAASMAVGRNTTNRGTTVSRTGELIATGGTFAGHLSSLVVGEQLLPFETAKTFTGRGTLDLRAATITDFQVTGDVTIGYSGAPGRIAPDASSLPGTLQLWLDAGDVHNDGGLTNPAHGATITQWLDKSGNDLVAVIPSGYTGPSYHTTGVHPYNDKPILDFAGGAAAPYDRLRVSNFVTNELQNTRFTAFIVMDGSNGVANSITGAVPRLYLQGQLFAYDVLSPTVNWTNPAGYNIHAYQHDGSNISAWLDGVLMGSLERSLASTTGHLEIPFKTSVERFAEIIIFTHDSDADVFTDAQRLAVERYLQNKYTGVWQNSQGYVYLSQVEGSIGGSLKVGDTAAGSEGLLELHGTHLEVAGDVSIYDTGSIRVFVPDVAAGLSLLETSSLGIGSGASYDIRFAENPAAGLLLGSADNHDAIHYGLKWSGDHVDALTAASLTGKLTWDDTTYLTGPFSGSAGIFFDAGANATYVGFYVVPEPSTLVLLAAALAAFTAARRTKRPPL